MIKHVVCFKLVNNSSSNCAQTKKVLESMLGKVPTAKAVQVNINELQSDRSFDIMLEVIVDSWAMLDEYQKDPYHCNVVKKHMNGVTQQSIALDFEV